MLQTSLVVALQSVRWVAFDAVGTLIYPDPPVAAAYYAIGRKYGTRLTPQKVADRFRTAFRDSEQIDRSTADIGVTADASSESSADGLITSESIERRRWQSVVATIFDDVPQQQPCFQELFDHFARPGSWKAFPDVAETLEVLQQRGYQLAAASNFDERLNRICDELPELRPLRLRVISSLVGFRKPSRQFYQSLVTVAGCAAPELLMVGDDYENDVQGASQAGLPTVYLQRNDQASAAAITSLSKLLELLPGPPNEHPGERWA